MKKILCFIGILVSCQSCMIQKSFTLAEMFRANANRLKTEVNFAKWPGKNEPMRVAPVLLDLFRFPTITDKSPLARKFTAGRSGISPNVELTLRHQYLLGNLEKKHRLEINLFIAPSSAEAHEYTILRFAANSLPHEMRVEGATPTRELRIGHVCFVNGNKNENRFAIIRFIRNNILVEIRAEGETFQREARRLAETIDYLLLKEKTGEDAAAYYNRELQRLKENRRRGIREKITRESP